MVMERKSIRWLGPWHSIQPEVEQILKNLGISFANPVHRKPRAIAWKKPNQGWCKLNVDGSSRGNPGMCRGGKIIRDANGSFIYCFSYFYGIGSNSRAELLVMLIKMWKFWLYTYSI